MQTQMRTCLSLLSLRPPANPQTETDDPADAPRYVLCPSWYGASLGVGGTQSNTSQKKVRTMCLTDES
jgi:hypothetical protein